MTEIFTKNEVRNITGLIESQLQENIGAINEAFENMGEFAATIGVKAIPVRGQVEVSVASAWTKEKFKTRGKLRFNPNQLPMFPE